MLVVLPCSYYPSINHIINALSFLHVKKQATIRDLLTCDYLGVIKGKPTTFSHAKIILGKVQHNGVINTVG